MLKSLHIKNYAIIEDLTIDFEKNLNAFTGETGAGKSIIIGALTFLVRGKADTSIIRNGQDKAIVEGVFDVEDYMKPILDEAEIEYDDELAVRRIVSSDGKNSIKVNQTTVTLSFLNEIFNDKIDIHSQKDSQFLLNKKNHLNLLDKYANNSELLSQYKEKYKIYTKVLAEYDELVNGSFSERELEFIKYDLEEITNANLKVEEEAELEEKEKRYKSAEKYLTVLGKVTAMFNEEGGAKEILHSMIKELNLDDNQVEEIKENMQNEIYVLSDEVEKLENILDSFNDGNCDINFVQERLYLYSKLKRKFGKDVSELIEYKTELENKIAAFDNREVVIANKKTEVEKAKAEALEIANKLHNVREEFGQKLSENILAETTDLMLKNVQFKTEIQNTEINNNGIDDVEFLVSMNKGENLKPLKDVASGGEISRFMLSLKTIFSRLNGTILAIFDEIDTGVSGKVGMAMGLKMSEISDSTQVITITHLSSVAACADSNYYIYKEDNSDSTITHIKKLNKNEIVDNLALISSSDKTTSSIEAAKELYITAQEAVKNNRNKKALV